MFSKVLISLFGFFFLSVGVFCARWAYNSYTLDQKAVNWPSVQGQVLSAKFIDRGAGTADDEHHATYAYNVKGKMYQSSIISGDMTYGYKAKGLKIGDSVEVFYNPENPKEAMLDTTGDGFWTEIIATATCFALFGLSVKELIPSRHPADQM